MPLPSRAEHEIVARRAPRRLLQHLGVGHAVLGEEALLLGDEQRAGIGERDEAELGALHLGTGALRERAAGKLRLHGAEQRGGAGGALEEFAAADRTSVRVSFVVIVLVVLSGLAGSSSAVSSQQKSRSLQWAFIGLPQVSGVACRPVVGPRCRHVTAPSRLRSDQFKLRARSRVR